MAPPPDSFPNLRLVRHPVADACLTELRDASTNRVRFRLALQRLSYFVAIEASRGLATEPVRIRTPLEETEGCRLADRIVKVPILRAGLALLPGFEWMFPDAPVGHLGVARNEETLRPAPYLKKLPDLTNATVFVLDPMVATGGSAAHTINVCLEAGARRIVLASILASPEGLRMLNQGYPEVAVITVAVDRQLNDKGYIMPGLGDAGDRYFGTA